MAEVGLLPFARVALQVAKRVLPPYRSRFSKHQFTQPQLLAVLCLMRYEDWTFREAEVRLGEHRDLREVLQLQTVPDYTTLYRFLKRLEDDLIDRGLGETVRRHAPRQNARARFRGHRWHGVIPTGRQYVLPAPHRAAPWRKAMLPTLSKVAGGGGRKASNRVGAASTAGTVDRHAGSAGISGCCGPTRATPCGAGGCRVRFRSEPSAHSATVRRAKHYSGATSPGYSARNPAQPNVPRFSAERVWTTSKGGNGLLGGETQTLRQGSRPLSEFTDPPSAAPRPHLQPLPPQAAPTSRGNQQSHSNSNESKSHNQRSALSSERNQTPDRRPIRGSHGRRNARVCKRSRDVARDLPSRAAC